jgi:hypothetical protein
MAINAQKLLPPGKLTAGERMSAAYDKKIDDLLNLKVKKKLINVDKFIGNTKKTKEKTQKVKKKKEENKKRKEKEDRLEKAKSPGISALKLPSLPKTGILDSISNFVQYTFLGYLLGNYSDKLGGLGGVIKTVMSALDTVSNLVVGTVDISASIIKGIYDTKDKLSKQVDQLGGKDAKKTFDNFTTGFKDMINKIMSLGLYQPPVPQKTNGGIVQKMAVGGNVTRAGRPVGGISRAITVKKTRPIKVKPPQSVPGKDIGGEKEIQKMFPDPMDFPTPDPEAINPLRSLKTTSKTLKEVPFLGGIMGAAIDIAMGQKPDKNFYRSLGSSIGALIQSAMDNELGDISKTVFAMAEGGPITRGITRRTTGEQIGMQIAKMFESKLDVRINQIFKDLLKELTGTPIQGAPGAIGATSGELAAGTIARGQVTMEQLIGLAKGAGFSQSDAVIMAAIAMAESGGDSNAHNRKPPDNSYGLWQINMLGPLEKERLQLFGITNNEQLKDPVTNAHAAKIIKQRQGFGAWSVYKSGVYRSYLGSAQKAAAAPAITVYKPSIAGGDIPLGKISGNLAAAQQLAASMGLTMTSFNTGRHAKGSLHYQNRAMDFSNGYNTPQQLAFAKALISQYGKSISQLIYTPLGFGIADGKVVGLDYWGDATNRAHYDHVHIGFARGGRVNRRMFAQLGEKGPEFVFDSDTTKSLDGLAPGLLEKLNMAKTKKDVSSILQSYADYEQEIVFVFQEKVVTVQGDSPVNFPGVQQSIMNPSVNSSIPMSVG